MVQDSGLVSILYKGFEIIFSQEGTLESLQIVKEGKVVYKYRDIKNTGELPLPNKTPEVSPLMDSPRVLIPEGGYAPDSDDFVIEDEVKDLFLLFCEKDQDQLFGRGCQHHHQRGQKESTGHHSLDVSDIEFLRMPV